MLNTLRYIERRSFINCELFASNYKFYLCSKISRITIVIAYMDNNFISTVRMLENTGIGSRHSVYPAKLNKYIASR